LKWSHLRLNSKILKSRISSFLWIFGFSKEKQT
jgi:hypothetical protein